MTVQNHLKYLQIFGSWTKVFNPIIDNGYIDNLINFLDSEYKTKTIFPAKTDVFKVFRYLDPSDVKIVILGYDPYPNKNATGIPFGNREDALSSFKMSPSLNTIFTTIEKTCYKELLFNFDFELKHLLKQGVLLLNSSLTVEENNTGSHSKYWAKFTKCILEYYKNTDENIIYCLWGSNAKSFKQFIKGSKYILEANHPASAARIGRDWDCNHFNQVNAILESLNKQPINWGNTV